jgi:hypothetical protein
MKNKEQLESYKNSGKLLSPKLPCTKCQTPVTLFGSNLENRIKKYGGLENLLDTFTCRSCNSTSKPQREKKVVVKREKKEQEEVVYDIPKMKGFIPTNAFLKDTPELVQSMTHFSCVSPQLYLNNNRGCRGCVYFDNCNCALKKAA